MSHITTRFSIGFSIGLLASATANVMPYLSSRNAFMTDGYEVVGFPYTFRRRGGYVYTYQFHTELLWADVAIVMATAIVTGVAAVLLLRHLRQQAQGFLVIHRGLGGPEAG